MEESPPTQNQSSAFGSDPHPNARASRKKVLVIIGVILLLLTIGGGGFSYWAIQNRNNQLALQAKVEAQRQVKAAAEAKAREGTVKDLKSAFEDEVKETQDLNDRFIFSAADTLKREAEAAATAGTGNENGI